MIIDTKQTILNNKFSKLGNMMLRSPLMLYLFAAFTRPIRYIFFYTWWGSLKKLLEIKIK